MNTIIITIFTTEIIALGLILYCLISLDKAVNRYRQKVIAQNKKLKKMFPTAREIITLSYQYLELWKSEFAKKVEACGNLLGEITVYYIMHKIFKKQYEGFETGFNFIKLFW